MGDTTPGSQASKIEIAKRLKAIKDIAETPEQYEAVKHALFPGQDLTDVEKSITGLSEEDEFALLCRLMETTTHLVRLEQNPIIAGDFIVPDFWARFQPGCRWGGLGPECSAGFTCLVEVKSTKEKSLKIGGSLLRRRRNLAKQFGLPLVFAVRFLHFQQSAIWVMVDASDDSQTSLTVTVDDMLHGVRHVLWDEVSYLLHPDVQFRYVYDSAPPRDSVYHPDHGQLIEFQIVGSENELTLKDWQAGWVSGFCDGFAPQPVHWKREGTVTVCTSKPQVLFCDAPSMIYKFNHLATDEGGRIVYNASKILARSDQSDAPPLMTRSLFDLTVRSIEAKGLMSAGVYGTEDPVAKWRRYGGRGNGEDKETEKHGTD